MENPAGCLSSGAPRQPKPSATVPGRPKCPNRRRTPIPNGEPPKKLKLGSRVQRKGSESWGKKKTPRENFKIYIVKTWRGRGEAGCKAAASGLNLKEF